MSERRPTRTTDPSRSLEPRTSQDPNALRALYENAVVTWRLFWDERVSLITKAIPIAAVAYVISPIDIAPELLMGPLAPLGYLDDVGVLLLSLRLFVMAAPPDVVREHLRQLGSAISSRMDPSRGTGTDEMSDDDIIDGEAEIVD